MARSRRARAVRGQSSVVAQAALNAQEHDRHDEELYVAQAALNAQEHDRHDEELNVAQAALSALPPTGDEGTSDAAEAGDVDADASVTTLKVLFAPFTATTGSRAHIELTLKFEYGNLEGRWTDAVASGIKDEMKSKGCTLATGVFEYYSLAVHGKAKPKPKDFQPMVPDWLFTSPAREQELLNEVVIKEEETTCIDDFGNVVLNMTHTWLKVVERSQKEIEKRAAQTAPRPMTFALGRGAGGVAGASLHVARTPSASLHVARTPSSTGPLDDDDETLQDCAAFLALGRAAQDFWLQLPEKYKQRPFAVPEKVASLDAVQKDRAAKEEADVRRRRESRDARMQHELAMKQLELGLSPLHASVAAPAAVVAPPPVHGASFFQKVHRVLKRAAELHVQGAEAAKKKIKKSLNEIKENINVSENMNDEEVREVAEEIVTFLE